MTPIRIIVEVLSPIELPKYPIHLDGLLFWALKDESDITDEEALIKLDSILAKDGDIYKASSMRFIRSVDLPIVDKEIAHPTRTHWNEWKFTVVEKSKTITTKGGPFRKRMTIKAGISAGFVEFNAVGDAMKIQYLLDSLGFIGLSNRQGFGEIGEIQVDEINEDYSFYDENGELARVLPIAVAKQYCGEYLSIKNSYQPPYKTSARVDCLVPNFRVLTK